MKTFDPTEFGFHAMTPQDRYGYGGAQEDAFLKEVSLLPNEKDGPALAAIFSASDGTFHVYIYELPDVEPAITVGIMINDNLGGAIIGAMGLGRLIEAMQALPEITFENLKQFGIQTF